MLKCDRSELIRRLEELKNSGYDYLVKITAVDYEKNLTALYFLRDLSSNKDETLEVDLDYSDAWLPTAIDVHKSADWYEREMMEMFGIEIRGRVTKRILLEKWDGVEPPLRKGFEWGKDYKTSGSR
ncbi:MAG: NADH-quinone oxidoreductase subunit C [Candidatus Micrarchaeaceae archaeon]